MIITILYWYAMYKVVDAMFVVGTLTKAGTVGLFEGIVVMLLCLMLMAIGTFAHIGSNSKEKESNKNV